MEAEDGETEFSEFQRGQLLRELGYNKVRDITDLQREVQNNYLDMILRHELPRTPKFRKLLKGPLDSLSEGEYDLFLERYSKLQSLGKVQSRADGFEAALSQAKQLIENDRAALPTSFNFTFAMPAARLNLDSPDQEENQEPDQGKKRRRRESVESDTRETKMPRLVGFEKDVLSRLCDNGYSSLSMEAYADLSRILEYGKSGEYRKCSLTFLSFLMKIYPNEKLTEIVPRVPQRMTVSCRKISERLQYIENWESGGRIHLEFPVTGSKRDKIECLVMWDMVMVKYGPPVHHNLEGDSSVHDLAEKLREKWSHFDEGELKKGFDWLTSDENMTALNENMSMNSEVLESELRWAEKMKIEAKEFLASQETAGQARSGDQSGREETSKEQSAGEGEACPHSNVQSVVVGPQTWTDPVDVPRHERERLLGETLGHESESKGCNGDDTSCPDPSADVTKLELLVGSTVDLEEALQKERESNRSLEEALSKGKTELQDEREKIRELQERLQNQQNQQNQAGENMRQKEEEIQHLLKEKQGLVSKSSDASQEHLRVSKDLEETTKKFQFLIGMMRQYLAQEEPYMRQKSEVALFDANEESGDELDDGDGSEPRQDDDSRFALGFLKVIEKKDRWYRDDIQKLEGNIEKCVKEKQSLETQKKDLEVLQQQQSQRIEDQKREAHGLAQEKADLRSHVESLEKKLQEQTALRDENLKIIENARNELSSLQKASAELQQEHKSATQRTAEKVEEQWAQMKTEIVGLKAENKLLRSEKEAMSVQSECRGKIIEDLTNLEHEKKVEIETLGEANQNHLALQKELLQKQAEAVQRRSEEYEKSEQERRKLKDEMESLQQTQNTLKQDKEALQIENHNLSEQLQNLSREAYRSRNESVVQGKNTMNLRASGSRQHRETTRRRRNQCKQSETARKDHATGIKRKEQWRQTGSNSSSLALLRLTRIFLYHNKGIMPCHIMSCEVCQNPSLLGPCGNFLDAEGIIELLGASGILSSSAMPSGSIFYPSSPNHMFHPRVQELMLQVDIQMAKNRMLLSDCPETLAFLTILQTIGAIFSGVLKREQRFTETEQRFMETEQIYAQSIEQLTKDKEECEKNYAVLRQRLSQEMEQVELNKTEIVRLENHASLLTQEKVCIGLDLEETEARLMEINRQYKKLEQDSGARIRELEQDSKYDAMSTQSMCDKDLLEQVTCLKDEREAEIQVLKQKMDEGNHALQEQLLGQADAIQKRSEEYEKLEQEREKMTDEMESLQQEKNGLKQDRDALERENCKLSEQVKKLSSGSDHSKNESPAQSQRIMHLMAKANRQRQETRRSLRDQCKRPETARNDHATGIESKGRQHQTGSKSSSLALLRLTRIFLYYGEGSMPCHILSCEVCQGPSFLDSCGRLLDAEGIIELLSTGGILSSSAMSSDSMSKLDLSKHTLSISVGELMSQVNIQMAKNQVLLSDGPETIAFLTILRTIRMLLSRILETQRSLDQWMKHSNETKERLMEINRRYEKLEQDSNARIRQLEQDSKYGEDDEALISLQHRLNTEIVLKKRLSEQGKKFEQGYQSQAGGLNPFTEPEHARKLQQSRLALMRLIRLMCYNGEGLMPCLTRDCMKCLSSGSLKDLTHHPNGRQLLDLLEESGFQRSYMYAMLTLYSNPPENAKGLHPQVLDLMKLALGELDQPRQDGDAGTIIPEVVCFKTLVQGIVALRSDAKPYILGKKLLQEREEEVTKRESMMATKDKEHQQNVQMIRKLKSDVQQQKNHINNLLTERAHHVKSLEDLKNNPQSKVDSQREMRDLQERMLCSKLALLELIRIFLLYSDKGSPTACCIENCFVCQRPAHESDFSHPPSKARVSSLLEKSGLLHVTSPLVNSDPPLDSCYDNLRANALDYVQRAQNSPHCSPEAKHFVSLLSTIGRKVRDQRSRERELKERNLEVQGLREEKEKQWGTTNHSIQRRALRDVFTLLISERNSGLAYNHDVDGLLQKAGLKCSSVVRALYATPVGDALSADINLPETTDLYLEYEPLFLYIKNLHGKIITTPRLFKARTSSPDHSPKSTNLSCASEEPSLQQREFHGQDGQPVRQNTSKSPRVHEPEDTRAQKSVSVDANMTSTNHTEAQPKTSRVACVVEENESEFCPVGSQVDEDWSGWPTNELESSPKGKILSEEARYKSQVTALQEKLEALQKQREKQEDSMRRYLSLSIATQGPNYLNKRRLGPAADHTNPDKDRPRVPVSEPTWDVRFLGNTWEIHGVESCNNSLYVLIHRAVSKRVVKRHIPLLSLFAMENSEEAKSNADNLYAYYTSKGYKNIPDSVSFESATEVDKRGNGQSFRVTFREKRSPERNMAASKLAMFGSHVAKEMSPEWLKKFLESNTRLTRVKQLHDI